MTQEKNDNNNSTVNDIDNIEMFKAFLQYKDIKKQQMKKKYKYKITILLDIINSDSGEYSAEDELSDNEEDDNNTDTENISSNIFNFNI